MPEQALGHLKVLELCNLVSGPYCTKLLADLGAEVIKMEPPDVGDQARRRGPFPGDVPHQERSGLYLYLNTNKLGITLDVKTKTGKRILKELIKQTDVFVEDNPPAVMEELGLNYQYLKDINPRLVMTSITPFGQTGPYRDYKAYDLNCFHAGGEGYLLPSSSPDLTREPVKGGGLVGEGICGLSACLATLAATYWMGATGVGQYIDISKQDVLMTMVGVELSMFANMGEVRKRLKGSIPTPAPVKCSDGHIVMVVPPERPWQHVVKSLDELSGDGGDKFSQRLDFSLPREEIAPQVEEWILQFRKEDLFHKLQANGVASAPVYNSEELFNSPQIKDRGFLVEIEHPETGKLEYPSAAYKFSRTPWGVERPAPLLGQHNEIVYCNRLGYDKQSVAKLKKSGII